ncbi:alpha-N-acetylglucosaminidase [Actinocatenispora comari]|uniref:Alpha-N-acetylglucosaminidase n=1 Tax=Actinocatenispora comari TaxID=2807577 RepID=A0A8J4ABT0_9ACTN|nr:alpha-N-acetylglucosaminidase TIM-barrel domain-containing protein [Actinocatenispora comari]GIL25848.1 alpha-N-acetylglucosaminidase [Actinocatenispora comari]
MTPTISAARAVLERLLGRDRADRFELVLEPGPGSEFRIEDAGGTVRVTAPRLPDLLAGARWYVSHVAHGHLSRHGDRLPTELPPAGAPVRRRTRHTHRFAHNHTVSGYSASYWGWAEWEREIDFLAWSGTTHLLVLTGQEIVWRDLLVELGFTDEAARGWLSMPGHLPWQWMGNLYGYGGGQPTELLEQRAALGRRILDRLRELDITPVLPGFAGFVPQELVDARDDLTAVPQGKWLGFDRPTWIDPTAPGFRDVAGRWYRLQAERFGASTAYSMDVLHEGGLAGGMDICAAAANLQGALLDAHPDATWVVQAWGANPTPELLAGVDPEHLLVLDINADDTPRWRSRQAFDGAPWVFGTISTWGGRQYVFGKLPEICRLPALTGTGRLCGTVQAAESLESNPVVDDLLADAIWSDAEIDLDDWIAGYVRRRYGTDDGSAVAAWHRFVRTAYGQYIADDIDGTNAGPDSLFVARPALDAQRAIEWRPWIVPYDVADFEAGWRSLIRAAPAAGESEPYRHDLVDVTVQVLSNRSRWLLPQLRAAVDAGDDAAVDRWGAWFLRMIDQCEQVLATRSEFLLGTWLAQAAATAGPAGVDDISTLVTTWGDTPERDELHDYAARHAAGLMAGHYARRWRRFLTDLRAGRATTDWYDLERGWARELADAPTEPRGDTVATASDIAATLPPVDPPPVTVSLRAEPRPDGTAVTATVVNEGTAEIRLDRARLLRPSADPLLMLDEVLAPGAKHELTWLLPATATGTAEAAVYFDPSSRTTHTARAHTQLPPRDGDASG